MKFWPPQLSQRSVGGEDFARWTSAVSCHVTHGIVVAFFGIDIFYDKLSGGGFVIFWLNFGHDYFVAGSLGVFRKGQGVVDGDMCDFALIHVIMLGIVNKQGQLTLHTSTHDRLLLQYLGNLGKLI